MKTLYKIVISFLSFGMIPSLGFAQEINHTSDLKSFMQSPILVSMALIAILLLWVIYVLAKVSNMVLNNKFQGSKMDLNEIVQKAVRVLSILGLLFVLYLGIKILSQGDVRFSVSPVALFAALFVILAEILTMFALLYVIRKFASDESVEKAKEPMRFMNWLAKYSKAAPLEREADVDSGHNYDGIRELDNPTPPWWNWAFYVSMVFAAIYMWRYHIAKSAPLMIEEYQIAVEKADKEKQAYLKSASNAVDENTVKLLDKEGIVAGQAVFAKNCTPCHGPEGGGNTIGPNLTDAYWIHGGSIQDIFKSVKYGWPEKGMQPWEQLLAPNEIAQVASFIKSIQGSNPANAKESQGDLYVEEANAPDTSSDSSSSNATEQKELSDSSKAK